MESRERVYSLMFLYQGLWLSADFEEDLKAEFPDSFRLLRSNENKLTDEELFKMIVFMNNHPVFL